MVRQRAESSGHRNLRPTSSSQVWKEGRKAGHRLAIRATDLDLRSQRAFRFPGRFPPPEPDGGGVIERSERVRHTHVGQWNGPPGHALRVVDSPSPQSHVVDQDRVTRKPEYAVGARYSPGPSPRPPGGPRPVRPADPAYRGIRFLRSGVPPPSHQRTEPDGVHHCRQASQDPTVRTGIGSRCHRMGGFSTDAEEHAAGASRGPSAAVTPGRR
jgi:hypothetical protein